MASTRQPWWMDIVVQDDAHAVCAVEPGKDQHEQVVQAPEGRLPALGDDLKVDGIHAQDDVHVEQVKADQQRS